MQLYLEEIIKAFRKTDTSKALFVSDVTWFEEIKQLSSKYDFDTFLWNFDSQLTIKGFSDHYETLVICAPEGEQKIYETLARYYGKGNSRPLMLRLIRDIFLRNSLLLGTPFKSQDEWKRYPGHTTSYFIFAIPRTGSSFLSDILKNTHHLGKPQEHLLKVVLYYMKTTDLKIDEWLEYLTRYSFTKNGYSGTKLISHLFLEALDDIINDDRKMENLKKFFTGKKVIYLKRLNRLRQAISLLKAKKSGIWHYKKDMHEIKSDVRFDSLEITSTTIEETIDWIISQEKQMEEFFTKMDVEPMTVYYEDLAYQPSQAETINNIINYLGVDFRDKLPESNFIPLADEKSDAIVEKYLMDLMTRIRKNKETDLLTKYDLVPFLLAEIRYKLVNKNSISKKSDSLLRWFKLQ